ncbi:hemicentin-2-like [Poecilia latipinna]|uniref:hemicentin-2-like n=1 Tax=Poecilia latipinna TaxID=48699 RepID=UPI00072EC94A|nr:PREDICTED: hemicentin-2-like [Poecilia latipinna]
MFLLPRAAAQTIRYRFGSTCAVRGSTVILPCYFTPLKSFSHGGREIPLRIVRVLWCKNHQICHKTTPSVYDSNSTAREPRFHYLGNMEANCTLQIRDIRMEDKGTFRFRMEADNSAGHFTNQAGVRISVADLIKMKLKSSSKRSEVSRGQTVSLQCTTSTCTFTHLEVTWRKDGHALPGNGSALQLGPLTAKDSGNYSCALRGNMETQSEPFSLQVEEKEEEEEEGWFWFHLETFSAIRDNPLYF